jgi:hypothetical protein
MYGNSTNGNSNSKVYKGTKGANKEKPDNKGEEKVFRGPFASNVMGLPIVNAITGVKYPWTVGSFEENHLWKVANCTRFTPMTYFYDSPEQYEAYRWVQVDPESKAAWHTLQKNLD